VPSFKNEWVVTSFSATKYDPDTKVFTAYTPSVSGQITVSANDIVKFLYPNNTTKTIPLTNISIYAITNAMKVQINDNAANPIYIDEGGAKLIEDIQINSIKFLTSGTVYFEGLSPSGFLPVF
jgi:hypothetical protein